MTKRQELKREYELQQAENAYALAAVKDSLRADVEYEEAANRSASLVATDNLLAKNDRDRMAGWQEICIADAKAWAARA